MRKMAGVCFLAFSAFACNKPLPTITSFSTQTWQKDPHGCNGYRARTEAELAKEADNLRGLSQMQIVNVLGKPDQNELYKRNQKFFYYWLSGSPICGEKKVAKRLSVRFNAMGYAKEVLIE